MTKTTTYFIKGFAISMLAIMPLTGCGLLDDDDDDDSTRSIQNALQGNQTRAANTVTTPTSFTNAGDASSAPRSNDYADLATFADNSDMFIINQYNNGTLTLGAGSNGAPINTTDTSSTPQTYTVNTAVARRTNNDLPQYHLTPAIPTNNADWIRLTEYRNLYHRNSRTNDSIDADNHIEYHAISYIPAGTSSRPGTELVRVELVLVTDYTGTDDPNDNKFVDTANDDDVNYGVGIAGESTSYALNTGTATYRGPFLGKHTMDLSYDRDGTGGNSRSTPINLVGSNTPEIRIDLDLANVDNNTQNDDFTFTINNAELVPTNQGYEGTTIVSLTGNGNIASSELVGRFTRATLLIRFSKDADGSDPAISVNQRARINFIGSGRAVANPNRINGRFYSSESNPEEVSDLQAIAGWAALEYRRDSNLFEDDDDTRRILSITGHELIGVFLTSQP